MSVDASEVNHPDVLRELEVEFARYETALVNNDVASLDELFWDTDLTIRYGTAENLYGHQSIAAFRAQRASTGLAREILRRRVTTFGRDFGVTSIEFSRLDKTRIGRQTQTWVRMAPGWRVVGAHVSWMETT